jgi:hypothetical protein
MVSELQILSERSFQAWLERDATTVERLVAEDYLYIAPNGLVLDRQTILRIIRSPSYRLDRGTRRSLSVPRARRRAWCGTGIRGPARSRAPLSRMTSGVSWSGRDTPNGDS